MVGWVILGVGAVTFGVVTWWRGSLTVGGALAAVVIGVVVAYCAGVEWLLPLFVFFLSSGLIGRLLPVELEAGDAKDKQPRDLVQVLCNGGIYGLLALLGGPQELMLVTMAVASSDTWASEIGKYFRQPTYDILRLRRVPPGLSGGVSVAGTLGGAAGAASVAMLAFLLLANADTTVVLRIAAVGFFGMLLDSLLGAGLQARYDHPERGLSDTRRAGSRLSSGYNWMTNDLVNLLAIAVSVVVALLAF
ncbi:uncharacterized protein (TIGR00297 family) [Lewinella aquimaris]|uniref:Uncharacterized protein (TIGR00297 family) n=1 Tax=Neolewinella aquimaris TaxID=1835722 RepID=A0A840E6H4_9BACT|nr:DUF92 domain-containing protein [Neolewinella aquimaris]MBB4080650.1 uncharacterized protein (TIGR00297 family) [Neolewinella aquimaris]